MKNMLTGQNIRPPANAPGTKRRAKKSGLTKRAVDVCPACDGIGKMKLFGITLHCSTCHGTGKRN